MNVIRNKRLSVVWGVLAVLLPAHPSLQEIFVSIGLPSVIIALSLFLLSIISHGTIKLKKIFYVVLGIYTIFLCLVAIGLVRSQEVAGFEWQQVFVSVFLVTPMVLVCAYISSCNEKLAGKVIIILSGFVLIHVIYKIYTIEIFSGFIALNNDPDKPNYQATSFYLGLFAVFFIRKVVVYSRMRFITSISIFILTCVAMGLVGARSGFLALWVVFLIILFFKNKTGFMLLLSGMVVIIFMLTNVYSEIAENILIFQRFASLGEDDSSSRMFLFSSAIELWLLNSNTLIFGSGIASFPAFINANEPGWYPHNFVLEILAEIGIVGLIPIIAILILFFSKFSYVIKNDIEYKIFIYGVSLYALISYQFMGGVNTIWIPFYFVFLAIFSTIKIGRMNSCD